jgi:predicted transcriptional regulator
MQTTAKDLMTKRFLRISTQHTLRETMGIILYGEQKKHDTGAIVIIDTEGEFAGTITPRDVVMGLLNDWNPPADSASQEPFLESAKQHLSKTIGETLQLHQPTAMPESSLAELIRLAGQYEYECIPIVEEGRVEGLVYISDLFKATANLALSPDTEGIILD